jgi:hypothetical protein
MSRAWLIADSSRGRAEGPCLRAGPLDAPRCPVTPGARGELLSGGDSQGRPCPRGRRRRDGTAATEELELASLVPTGGEPGAVVSLRAGEALGLRPVATCVSDALCTSAAEDRSGARRGYEPRSVGTRVRGSSVVADQHAGRRPESPNRGSSGRSRSSGPAGPSAGPPGRPAADGNSRLSSPTRTRSPCGRVERRIVVRRHGPAAPRRPGRVRTSPPRRGGLSERESGFPTPTRCHTKSGDTTRRGGESPGDHRCAQACRALCGLRAPAAPPSARPMLAGSEDQARSRIGFTSVASLVMDSLRPGPVGPRRPR